MLTEYPQKTILLRIQTILWIMNTRIRVGDTRIMGALSLPSKSNNETIFTYLQNENCEHIYQFGWTKRAWKLYTKNAWKLMGDQPRISSG